LSVAIILRFHYLCLVVFLGIYFLKFLVMNIFVSNLGFNIQDEDLKQFFAVYGEVSSAKIINDRETGRSRGFGFVEMPDDTAAANAISQLNESTVDGRAMKVAEARPKEDRGSSFGGGGFNGGKKDFNKRW
jgi:RNA recognition motif-containing protein